MADEKFEASNGEQAQRIFGAIKEAQFKIDERDFLGIIASESGFAPVDLDILTVDEGLLELVPQKMVEEYLVFPVTKIGNVLTLAVANPFDILKLDNINILTRCELRPVVACERAIHDILKRAFGGEEENLNEFFELLGSS